MHLFLRPTLAVGLALSLLGATAPTPALADSQALVVHGVTQVTTDDVTCDTRVEIGFRFDIGERPLSNGHLDEASVTSTTITVDGSPAAAYGVRTDFAVAPFYFASLDLAAATPGLHVVTIAGGESGVRWRAFNHADPTHAYVAYLEGDYALSFVVPPCGGDDPVTFSAFSAPVDGAPVQNVVQRGRTVPIRFSALRGADSLTDPTGFTVAVTRARCQLGGLTDQVERTVQPVRTGELFYDAVAQRLVYRWKAPDGKHPCWDVTFTHESGVSTTAHFRTYGR